MKQNTKWAIDAGILGVYVLAAGVLMFSLLPQMKTEAAAAWTQAIFSVIAIGAAIGISRKQYSDALKLKEVTRTKLAAEKIRTLAAIFTQIRLVTNFLKSGMENKSAETIEEVSLNQILDCKAALESLPLFEIPDHVLVLELIGLVRWIQMFADAFLEAKDFIKRRARIYGPADSEEESQRFVIAEATGEFDEFEVFYVQAITKAVNAFLNLHDMAESAVSQTDTFLRKITE